MLTTMKRLFLIFFLLVASLVEASAQDKLCCYTYAFSKYINEARINLIDKHVRPQYEGDTLYFVYDKEHNFFTKSTSTGRVVDRYHIEYNDDLCYYRIEDSNYALLGEFISLRFDVLMILRKDKTGQDIYDVYLLTSISDLDYK